MKNLILHSFLQLVIVFQNQLIAHKIRIIKYNNFSMMDDTYVYTLSIIT